MSDHFDGDDPRTDLTDVYVFPATEPGRTVLIMCVNPEPGEGDDPFDPAASYELKIDTNGDARPDVGFQVLFEGSGAAATASVYRSAGADADRTGAVGELAVERARLSRGEEVRVAEAGAYRFFAGVRSDPFFKDVLGFRNNFQFTGTDPIANRNVFGIALEVPDGSIGGGAPMRLWARTMVSAHGGIEQADRAGRPSINNLLGDEAAIEALRGSLPVDQAGQFTEVIAGFLRSTGYAAENANVVAATLLPDWLEYDPHEPSGYPNGRRLTDDISDRLAALLTNGRITSDGVGPHSDLLDRFPHLGPPRPYGAPTV